LLERSGGCLLVRLLFYWIFFLHWLYRVIKLSEFIQVLDLLLETASSQVIHRILMKAELV
jgi:hypothetical protein